MPAIDSAIIDLQQFDLLSRGSTELHHLDARAKVLVTIAFTLAVLSHGKYDLAPLFPYLIFPVAMITAGNLPASYIIRKVLMLSPFVIIIAAFNPLLDRQIITSLGEINVSGGWISFLSIIVRSLLTICSMLALIGLTGFNAICHALNRLGVPKALTLQLMFLYRYLFVLAEEGVRTSRARELRACGNGGQSLHSFGSLIGNLLLRTWQRAERVHAAMLARSFKGEYYVSSNSRFGTPEIRFILVWVAFFTFIRFLDITHMLGTLVMELFS